MFDVHARTILLVTHGSHAYCLSPPESDLDVKGVCVPLSQYFFGFLNNFEQSEQMVAKGNDCDKVVYSLRKFAHLAANANPNIIEVLYVADEDVLKEDEFGLQLREARDLFLSKKAKHTFSGYAYSQLKRIKTHRAWLLNPPKSCPQRRDFGLSETSKVSVSDLGAFEAVVAQGISVEMPKDVRTLFAREKQYKTAKAHYDQYINWTVSRNPKRSALEAKYLYDTKHASHLVRLMRMCKEILTLGRVIVRRPDREELLGIRNGSWSYEQLVEYAEKLEEECNELYVISSLRREPDRNKLDSIVASITEDYLRKHG